MSLVDGHTYSGAHAITVSADDAAQVLVEHVWTDLSNGKVTVSGNATVTWTLQDELSRHVVHELTWTRISDGLTGTWDWPSKASSFAGSIRCPRRASTR